MREENGKKTTFQNLLKNKKVYASILLLIVIGASYGGSYGIVQSKIDEKLENLTFENMFLTILGANITSLSETNLICNIAFESKVNSSFSDVKFKLSKFNVGFQNLTAGIVQIDPSEEIFDFQQEPLSKEFNISLPNPNFYNRTLQDFIANNHINLTFFGEFHLLKAGAIYPPFDFNFTLSFSKENLFPELFNDFNFTINDLDFNYADLSYSIDFSTIFFNPMNIDVNICSIGGNISFNMYELGEDNPPLNNIHLAQLNYTWLDKPLIIKKNQIFSHNFTFSGHFESYETPILLLLCLEEEQIEINLENITINLTVLSYPFSIIFSIPNMSFSTTKIAI
ncbi:hypothetical protein [Candidatus Lokiarchaeum ossiferum]|uniref:hypothetical protein n=1 Tax=Candidatus Lokiarchaeum ossiferum TaxID=2951803 RepID=UPI00352D5D7F